MPAFVLLWAIALAAVLGVPHALQITDVGDEITRNTARLALAYYAAALTLLLSPGPKQWYPVAGVVRWARACWSVGCITFLVHVAAAFHYYHGWSHADAVRHTEEVSGFGAGIYFSHLFTMLWTADVIYWWLCPKGYGGRAAWIDRGLHVYMFFIAFNGTIVYEQGPVRWAGIAVTIEVASLLLMRQMAVRKRNHG
jgi:hypothetical protein